MIITIADARKHCQEGSLDIIFRWLMHLPMLQYVHGEYKDRMEMQSYFRVFGVVELTSEKYRNNAMK